MSEDSKAEILAKALGGSEQPAAALHARLLDVVNHAPVIIFALDRNGVFTLAEGRSLALRGFPAEIVGKCVFDIYPPDHAILRNVRRTLAGESFTDTVEVDSLFFETWYAPIAGPEGGVLGVATDVTERRQMQATLLAAERMVSVGTIAASVAHEINNPLSYVVACLDLLVREGMALPELARSVAERHPDDPDVAKICLQLKKMVEPFEHIQDGVERMRLIAGDLRTFARADGREQSPVDVRAVVQSAIRMASNETRYTATVKSELGEVPWVLANEPRLAQVFLNLLVNAAQAFPDGASPETSEILVATRIDDGGRIVVEVRDNGPGIAAAVLPRIFEPFFTTKPVGVGTGLGLSVCRNIVESYGGEISVTSAVGKGTSFLVILPSTRRVSPSGPPVSSRRRESSIPPSGKRARVLVIDDDGALRNSFRLTLSQECSVSVVGSGADALDLLAKDQAFDFIFCDLMMPNLTGMEVFAELSLRSPEIVKKILFMTGGAFSPEIREFIARVPNRCLHKPFDPAETIRDALATGSLG
jgi:two-component system cell cycle sensor histidine kinase/response regulator CckA